MFSKIKSIAWQATASSFPCDVKVRLKNFIIMMGMIVESCTGCQILWWTRTMGKTKASANIWWQQYSRMHSACLKSVRGNGVVLKLLILISCWARTAMKCVAKAIQNYSILCVIICQKLFERDKNSCVTMVQCCIFDSDNEASIKKV